jgi:hypothetical protein
MDSLLLSATVVSLTLGTAMAVVAWRLLRQNADRRAARIDALRAMAGEAERLTTGSALESQPSLRPGRGLRVLGVAAAIAVCAALPYGLYVSGVFGAIASAAPSAGAPIELLSLRHVATDQGAFTVTGLVQNPVRGRKTSGLLAVLYLFDEAGRFVASGRAPLDAGTIQPGEEATFTVSIPKAAGVARYRVGFRYAEGGVAAHVDRRGQPPADTTEDAVTMERGRSTAISVIPPDRSEGE